MKIDKTYIISLPERRNDRLIPLEHHLKEYNWGYELFTAIKNNNGIIGLLETMGKLLTHILFDTNYETVLICEDDFRFLREPMPIIEKCFEQLPDNFDLLYLGCNLWQHEVKKYSENLIRLYDAYSTHSIVYSREGLEKAHQALYPINAKIPYDYVLKNNVMCEGKAFCCYPLLATQVSGYSNITNKIMNYERLIEKRFNERTIHLK